MSAERNIYSTCELEEVLAQITFENSALNLQWQYHCKRVMLTPVSEPYTETDRRREVGWKVWCSFERPDTNTGQVSRGRGRDELIMAGATVSSVVKTAWLLVELLVKHELMEGFRWRGARIFNPHNTVEALAGLQESRED